MSTHGRKCVSTDCGHNHPCRNSTDNRQTQEIWEDDKTAESFTNDGDTFCPSDILLDNTNEAHLKNGIQAIENLSKSSKPMLPNIQESYNHQQEPCRSNEDSPDTVNNREVSNIDYDEEFKHFQNVCDAFRYYRGYMKKRLQVVYKSYQSLSRDHLELVPDFLGHLQNVTCAVTRNYEFINAITATANAMFDNSDFTSSVNTRCEPKDIADWSMEKVLTTLKQFARDWSLQGKAEREQCYRPVLVELQQLFPEHSVDRSQIRVLVPGAGLGRLAYEIANLGFECQGNEFSMFMLFGSNFILNKCSKKEMFCIYPWVHQFSNNYTRADQLESIRIPDVCPFSLPPNSHFSMSAGDFLEVYREENSWDCIATVFFIDTAHNILQYIKQIFHILKPGGYWINLGPLLYHFANTENEMSIEFSYEEIKRAIERVSFKFLKEQKHVAATYTQASSSMLQYHYDCVYFLCQKPML